MPINAIPAKSNEVVKPMTETPAKGVLVEISHRSRYAVVAARKEVVKQFYLGVSVAHSMINGGLI